MKIVHCLFAFDTGGAQVLSIDLMNQMCIDNEVSLIIVNDPVNKDLVKQLDKRISVFSMNRKQGSKNPIPVIRLNLLLLKLNPDVIHCHEPRMALIIKVKKGKLVQTVHDVGISTDPYHLYKFSVAISDAVYKDVTSVYKKDGIETIYNGINFNLFKKRQEYASVKGQPLKLVQLSRLMHEKKGQDILLQALRKVINRNQDYAFTLDFIGSGGSQQYLEKMIADLKLEKNVTMAGERSRDWLFENLASYHALIQPSRYEGFGLTILEGLAAGLPVLASNIDGPAEIIADLPGGYLFENGDVDDCAAGLTRLYEAYGSGTIKEAMRTTVPLVTKKYSLKSSCEKYINLYNRLSK